MIVKIILMFPLLCGTISALLFLFQGGFGAGHGELDLFIGIFGLPSILLLDNLSLDRFLPINDFLLVVVVPAIMNFILFGSIAFVVAMLLKKLNKDT